MKPLRAPIILAALMATAFAHAQTISETENPRGWIIQTESSAYHIAIADDGTVIPVYYGPSANAAILFPPRTRVNPKVGSAIREVPYRGGFVNQTPILEAVFADGTRDLRLVYESWGMTVAEEASSLRIGLVDEAYGLRVEAFYQVVPGLDVIEKWLVIKNEGEAAVVLENAMSGSLWLPADVYDFHQLSGRWGHECQFNSSRLTQGVKTLQTRGMRSHDNPPWFAVAPADNADETHGMVWFGGLRWSGNWRIDAEQTHGGNVQVAAGINFWDTSWTLEPGETFKTPRMICGFADDGFGGASRRMHQFVNQRLLRPSHRDKLRPVLYNSWYATTFNVNEEQQVALAEVAAELGVELFVIDDGWFKGRKDDHAGLGDWTVDREKFPNGLGPMIERINAMGLDFGLWVEPEMANPDSDLYRAHPDWVFHYPNRVRHEMRNQLMLNLAREDVYQYLLDSLSALLTENNIRFVKWDYNRDLSDAGWPGADPTEQREVRIRYIRNLYRLVAELESRFPEVWFESCSGGGGRIDYGILETMDQFWTSDNTDPLDRLFIHDGFLRAFPANLMVSWVTDEDWHKIDPSMEFRYLVSMCGVLGVGNDITQLAADEREEAASYIERYKEVRPLVQQGIVHRLLSPGERENRAALQYVNGDGSKAAVFQFNLWDVMRGAIIGTETHRPARLRGLDPNATYHITGDLNATADGATLMNAGLPWVPNGSYDGALIVLEREP